MKKANIAFRATVTESWLLDRNTKKTIKIFKAGNLILAEEWWEDKDETFRRGLILSDLKHEGLSADEAEKLLENAFVTFRQSFWRTWLGKRLRLLPMVGLWVELAQA